MVTEVGVAQRSTGRRCEQQVVRATTVDLTEQRGKEESRHGNRSGAMAPRTVLMETPRDLDEVGGDVDALTNEVDVRDPQRRHLAEAKPRVGKKKDQCVVRGGALLSEPTYLVVCQEALPSARLPGLSDTLHYVARESSIANRELERLRENRKGQTS
jgi:hypothetical protein